MYLVLLVLAALINICSTLHCYKCTSLKEEDCLKNPSIIKCGNKMQGACMTLSYTEKKDNAEEKRYQKGCWESYTDCLNHCQLRQLIMKEEGKCEVSCCETDYCNKGGVEKPKLYQDKKKRSTGDNNAATSLASPSSIICILVASFSISFLSRNLDQ